MKFVLLILISITVMGCQAEVVQPNPKCGVAPKIVKAAHRYHGIRASTIDEFGFAYFYRDGRRCRLFTRDFLKRYGKVKGTTLACQRSQRNLLDEGIL